MMPEPVTVDQSAVGDNELIARMQAGSREAFDVLYQRYRQLAHRIARSASVDAAHAEEAVQEAFGAIWSSRATYRPDRPTASAWLLTVVRNRAIDIARRNANYDTHRVGDAILEHCQSPDDVAGEAIGLVVAGELQARLTRLPDAQREAIVLAFYCELSQSEIAARLDLPLGTVKARIRRGLDRLRVDLEAAAA
jgi:RNA polymerase sigma-70 factor, ECF subfamily